MRNLPLILAIFFLLFSVGLGVYVYKNFENPSLATGMYILLSCFLSLTAISFGWWVSLHIAKRQSTLTIISQSRLSEFYLNQIQNFSSVFPHGQKLILEQADDPDNKDALESLLVVLNFLEFISLGIKEGDLSESVCKAYFRQIFTNQWFRSSDYIHRFQVQKSNKLFINFEYYAKKWNPSLT
jgi:hypothetical protein